MRFPAIITLTIAVVVGVFVLIFIGDYTVSPQAVPSLRDYLASSTEQFGPVSGFSATSTSLTATSSDEGGADSRVSAEMNAGGVAGSAGATEYSNFVAPGGVIRVTTAKNPTTRERGLSGRARLADDEGLLFIFPQAGDYAFWMKDMNFAIDIIWISSNYRVVGVKENALPESYPESIPSPGRSQFVLEVNAGNAAKYGLVVGKYVSF